MLNCDGFLGEVVVAHPYLGFVAILTYAGTAMSCVFAANSSRSTQSHKIWWFCAAFFLVLAAVRAMGAESIMTENMRHWFHDQGVYGARRDLQRPISAGLVVVLSAVFALFWLKCPSMQSSTRQWAKFWGFVGLVTMTGVIAMRLISFHELDRLLYGPIKLNWLLDIGSSALVAWAAWRFGRAAEAGSRHRSRLKITPEGHP